MLKIKIDRKAISLAVTPLQSPKLSSVVLSQYLDGYPLGNTRYFKFRCTDGGIENGKEF